MLAEGRDVGTRSQARESAEEHLRLEHEFSICYCSIPISYDAAGIRPSKSIVGVWIRLKRGGRCIHGHGSWIQKFPMHDEVHRLRQTLSACTSCNTNGRHRHHPVMRNSVLKLREHPWELECSQWRET